MEGSRIKDEIKGILAILAGLVVLISITSHSPWDSSFFTNSREVHNMLGRFGANLSAILLQSIGYAAYLIPATFIITGIKMLFGKSEQKNRLTFIAAFVFLILATSSLLTLVYGKPPGDIFGGVVGEFSTGITLKLFSTIGSYLIFITLMLVSLMYIIQFSVISLAGSVKSKVMFTSRALSYIKSKRQDKPKRRKKTEPKLSGMDEEDYDNDVEPEQEPLPLTYPEIRKRPEVRTIAKPIKKIEGDYELPSSDLLNDPPPSISRPSKEELLQRSELLENKLLDYSVQGKVTYVSPGPIVTMFEFEPAPGVKINKVVSLADDLSMALKASSIRISPIHGRSTLGIEVPNKDRESVFIKDLIANDSFHKNKSKLMIALGKDIFGVPVMTDLAKMPHLLIAGATGSGKSVGLNSIVVSMLFKASPKEVKMLMIDPKMLELSLYEEIPHLLMPVITLPKEATNALKKMVFEMERRYRLLAESGARSIDSFNKKIEAENKLLTKKDELENKKDTLPYIVIFIDELADLMFASGRDAEDSIARLAGMARAAGIHLVLATQRPSVDVVTGIIKANFPSRISFQVSSKMDSRIILDTYGADQLLGKGDMLFTSPGKKMTRIHGAYVSEDEIRDVVNFIKAQEGPDYTLFEDLVAAPMEASNLEDQDDLYFQARDFVISAGKASISSIQRHMKIGYNRAARIMDMLEEEGIVGPPGEAGKPREVTRRL